MDKPNKRFIRDKLGIGIKNTISSSENNFYSVRTKYYKIRKYNLPQLGDFSEILSNLGNLIACQKLNLIKIDQIVPKYNYIRNGNMMDLLGLKNDKLTYSFLPRVFRVIYETMMKIYNEKWEIVTSEKKGRADLIKIVEEEVSKEFRDILNEKIEKFDEYFSKCIELSFDIVSFDTELEVKFDLDDLDIPSIEEVKAEVKAGDFDYDSDYDSDYDYSGHQYLSYLVGKKIEPAGKIELSNPVPDFIFWPPIYLVDEDILYTDSYIVFKEGSATSK